MLRKGHIFLTILLFSGFLLITGCSKSDDQREFENESLSAPSNFTATPTAGEITNKDPDDWRISPMYQGQIMVTTDPSSFTPPFPNPLNYNDDITISLYFYGIDNINLIDIYVFRDNPATTERYVTTRENLPSAGLETIILKGEDISNSTGGSQAEGLYRIRIFDGRENLITYGDIKIGTESTE